MMRRGDIKIAISYDLFSRRFSFDSMNWIRWLRVGEALARLGYKTDLIYNGYISKSIRQLIEKTPNLGIKSALLLNWNKYDVLKILFHKGFQHLRYFNGIKHPFIITSLGSVFASHDQEGIYFFGKRRKDPYLIQNELIKHSKYVVVLTQKNEKVLRQEYPKYMNVLRVPTGVDSEIPVPGLNPYGGAKRRICIFAGNIYNHKTQPELNCLWQKRINEIGCKIKKNNIDLYFIGVGATNLLDSNAVTCLKPVPNHRFWDYQYYADVGLALSDGPVCDNEASKIYYYLRGGLPVIAENPLSNSGLVDDVQYGEKVPYGNLEAISQAIIQWANHGKERREQVMSYMKHHHSWEKRIEVYDSIFKEEFNID